MRAASVCLGGDHYISFPDPQGLMPKKITALSVCLPIMRHSDTWPEMHTWTDRPRLTIVLTRPVNRASLSRKPRLMAYKNDQSGTAGFTTIGLRAGHEKGSQAAVAKNKKVRGEPSLVI